MIADVWIIVMIAVGLTALVIVLFLTARQKESLAARSVRRPKIDWAAANDEQVRQYLPDRKIDAIKEYRELTGVSLNEAKAIIEYLIRHPDEYEDKKKQAAYDLPDAGVRDLVEEGHIDEAVEVYRRFAGVDEYTARDAVSKIEQDIDDEVSAAVRLSDDLTDASLDPHILSLIASGKKIEAIQAYRDATGAGLDEATEAVEKIQRGS